MEYPGNPRGEEKLFIALRHGKEKVGTVCHCIKTTGRYARYEADAALMKGAVLYEANVLRFFYTKTIIDPRNLFCMPHDHLVKESSKQRYRIEGKMPDDFRAKLVTAIEQHTILEPKNKKTLLSYLDPPKSIT